MNIDKYGLCFDFKAISGGYSGLGILVYILSEKSIEILFMIFSCKIILICAAAEQHQHVA